MLERDAYSCESSGEGMGSQGTHGPEKVPTETEADMRRVPGLGTKASGADRTMTDLLDTLDGCISEIGPHTKGDNRSMTEVLDALESRIGELRARTMEPGWEGPIRIKTMDHIDTVSLIGKQVAQTIEIDGVAAETVGRIEGGNVQKAEWALCSNQTGFTHSS